MKKVVFNIIGLVLSIVLLSVICVITESYESGRVSSNAYYSYMTTSGGVTLKSYLGASNNISIPSEIDGESVVAIAEEAFEGNAALVSVKLPDSVKEIGDEAFENCINLKIVTIPATVTKIGKDAFKGCSELTIYAESDYALSGWDRQWNSSECEVVWGYDGNFESGSDNNGGSDNSSGSGNGNGNGEHNTDGEINYSNVYRYEYEDGGIKINSYIGTDTDVVIPETIDGRAVTEIGENAFLSNNRVTSITIPESVKSIDDGAFSLCTNLRFVTLYEGLTKIGDNAFYSCYNLKSIVIPLSVAEIGERAFGACHSLNIYCKAKVKPLGWDRNWNSGRCPVIWGYSG